MTNNKFWLVLTEKQAEEKFLTKEYAINDAKELAQKRKKPMYLMECMKVFDVIVNVAETSFEATPEESLAVEAKFKVGDKVLYEDVCEYFTGKSFWKDGVVIDIIGDQYLKIENKVTTEILTFELDSIMVKLAEPTPEPVEPKFKIGDRVLLDNYYECVVDDYFDETKSYKLSIISGGYNIANEIRITKK